LKLIIGYLLFVAIALTALILANILGQLPAFLEPIRVGLTCAGVGGIGGCVYCLRGVYLNACVRKQWDDDWQPWYYIRPLVSIACGAVSYVFLRAGLLILEAGKREGSTDLGFYALAFIAGLNVDKFIAKIEDIAQAAWGIEKSRAATGSSSAAPSGSTVAR
jgi:hypothetical protein